MQTEETKNADKNGPIGIISAIGISILVGWGYILGITFAVKDIPYLLSPDNDAGGYAIAEVFYLAFKSRYGSGVGGIACLGVVAVAIYFCGMSSVTSNSRMAYAFSRDGAMPFSSVWHKVNGQEVPINAVWLSAFIALCMALPVCSFHMHVMSVRTCHCHDRRCCQRRVADCSISHLCSPWAAWWRSRRWCRSRRSGCISRTRCRSCSG
jgi:amino acid transporter